MFIFSKRKFLVQDFKGNSLKKSKEKSVDNFWQIIQKNKGKTIS